MLKKLFIGIVMLILIAIPVFAADLEDYPEVFLKDVVVVVGRAAKAEDVIGAIDIVASLQQRLGKSRRLEGAILDTEVEDLESRNYIVVGGPCINSAAARLMGWPENCMEGFELGKGFIRMYEFDNGNHAILAAGTLAIDTRRVTSVLANYDDYAFSGKEMIVTGLSISDVIIESK